MRYTNWDVLIFSEAEDTKTPLQEFRTTCEVIQDASEYPCTPFIIFSFSKTAPIAICAG